MTKTLKFQVQALTNTKEKINLVKPDILAKAQLKFESHTFNVDLLEELRINENDLVNSMVEHAGNYGWWAGISTTARRALRKLKRDIEQKRNELDSEARASLKEQDIKVTEAAVSAFIASDPRVVTKNTEVRELEDLVDFTDMVLRALEHKRDMLKEINRAQCSEQFNERN